MNSDLVRAADPWISVWTGVTATSSLTSTSDSLSRLANSPYMLRVIYSQDSPYMLRVVYSQDSPYTLRVVYSQDSPYTLRVVYSQDSPYTLCVVYSQDSPSHVRANQ